MQLAEDGEQALEPIAQSVPEAVVLDVGLPGIDGLEVCRRVRRGGNRVPILMLTARDAVADRIDGLDVGADDYMVKPFDVGRAEGAAARAAAPREPRRATSGRAVVRRAAPGPRRVTGRRSARTSSSSRGPSTSCSSC